MQMVVFKNVIYLILNEFFGKSDFLESVHLLIL